MQKRILIIFILDDICMSSGCAEVGNVSYFSISVGNIISGLRMAKFFTARAASIAPILLNMDSHKDGQRH